MVVRFWRHGRLLKGVAWIVLLWTYVIVVTRLGKTPDNSVHPFCRPDMKVRRLPPLPEDDRVMLMELFTYLTKPHPAACRKKARFGGHPGHMIDTWEAAMDGEKYACLDPEFTLLTTDSCLVYSFGISTDWTFDWDMEGFGCSVHSFDPSINVTSGSQNGTISFLHYGIGSEDHVGDYGWQIRTLDTFIKFLGHEDSTIHYLKMDVEYAEYEVLRQQVMLKDESPLVRNVEQIGIELHMMSKLPVWEHMTFYREMYKTFREMQKMNYFLFHHENNPSVKADMDVPGIDEKLVPAMEVVWMKSRCVN